MLCNIAWTAFSLCTSTWTRLSQCSIGVLALTVEVSRQQLRVQVHLPSIMLTCSVTLIGLLASVVYVV